MANERKRVLIVGATGTIGGAVAELLEKKHEVVRIARTSGDILMDATSLKSIEDMFAKAGPFDALVSTMGSAVMGRFDTLEEKDFLGALLRKVLSQINLVRIGLKTIRPGGSFTISSGFLDKEPMPGFSAVAMANGAIGGFCKACALDLRDGIRVNCVSPVFVQETMLAYGRSDFTGFVTQSAYDTALAYQAAVEGAMSGEDIDPRRKGLAA